VKNPTVRLFIPDGYKTQLTILEPSHCLPIFVNISQSNTRDSTMELFFSRNVSVLWIILLEFLLKSVAEEGRLTQSFY